MHDSQDYDETSPTSSQSLNDVETINTLSEGRLKVLADSTIEGICIHRQGVILDANTRFCEMFGYTLDELRGYDCFLLIENSCHDMIRRYIASNFPGPYEAFYRRKDGTTFPAEVRARNFNLHGQQVRLVVVRDLTDQRKLQQQLVESENRYRELYDNSPIALYRTRISNGQLLECNQAFFRLFGCDSKDDLEWISHARNRYVDLSDRQRLREALKYSRYIECFRARVKRKNGQIFWVDATAKAYPDKNYMEGAMKDVTAMQVLTETEKRIVRLVTEGKSSKEIAHILHRSKRTIDAHRYHCMQKLQVSNLAELIQKAASLCE